MGIKKSKVCLATLILSGGLIGGLVGSGMAQADGCDHAQVNMEMAVGAAESADPPRFHTIVGRRRLWKEWRIN